MRKYENAKMTNLFNLKTIAVIGASSNPDKLGYQLLNNLITAGFTGSIYPINLKEKEILHLKSFSSVLDVHQRIDIAVIMVPREVVPEVLLQCVHKDIPFVLIISAGFAEKDKNGKKLQEEIIRITKNTKTKIVGPNCLGMVDTKLKINLTFAASEVMPGQIGLILQSGAIGAAIFDWAKENQIGISRFLSLGNKVHITEIDSLENFAEDSNTKIIVLYLEEITDPKEFLKICRKITLKKPIIILKGGLTLRGAKAASSHTGAL
ncbi:MAG: CoA-binding protein, partial [Candidatus Berkelbacteria bacterium]|nr:CoA-binding protein [Candidatus Berkelbacteria bacterium]